MACFLYFLPGVSNGTISRDVVIERGLGDVLRDCVAGPRDFDRLTVRPVVHGPEGAGGVIIAADNEKRDVIGYYPKIQTWENFGSYWLGFDTASPPKPADLERPGRIAGYDHILGDDQVWHVPIIRRYSQLPNLPRAMGYDAAGEFALRVLPSYEWAWDLSGRIYEKSFNPQQRFPFQDAFDWSVGVLSLNYRIGPREAGLLGLLTTENYQRVFDAAIDMPKVFELLGEPDDDESKKNESPPEPANTSPGPAENSPITPPPAEISTS